MATKKNPEEAAEIVEEVTATGEETKPKRAAAKKAPKDTAIEAVSFLIASLCEDARARRMRDEYKHYDAIAALMTSLK